MVVEALDYLINSRIVHGLIKGILLPGLDGSQLVNGHFMDDSF
jgi:hypothetical protein